MPANMTYGRLFGFLRNLGFTDVPSAKPDWAFHHRDTGTLLVFSMQHAEVDPVANADLVSTERFLRTKQLIATPLLDAVQASTRPSKP